MIDNFKGGSLKEGFEATEYKLKHSVKSCCHGDFVMWT